MSLQYVSTNASQSASITSVSTLPASITPTAVRYTPVIVQNSGIWQMGLAAINTNGTVAIYSNCALAPFSGSGPVGFCGILFWCV